MMDFEEEDEEVKYLILMSALEYANNEFNEEELIASFNQSTAGDNKLKEMTSSESSSAPPPPQNLSLKLKLVYLTLKEMLLLDLKFRW